MKKIISGIVALSMLAATVVMPNTALAAVSLDDNLSKLGFKTYGSNNEINAECSIVDSEEEAYGEVLQIYASGNADRNNRYGGVEYDLELTPGTYRFSVDYKCIDSTGTDVGIQVFTNVSITTHGEAVWGNLASYPKVGDPWATKSYTINVSTTGTYKVQLGVAGNHITFFDNVKLYETSDLTMKNLLPTSDFSTAAADMKELAAPENVAVSSKNYGEAILSWNEVPNASSYKIFKSVDNSAIKEVSATEATSAQVNNTTGRNTYYVQAIGDGINYSDSNYGSVSFEEKISKAGLPDGFSAFINNATNDIIFTYEVVDGGVNGDKALKMTQHTPGTNGDNFGGIRVIVDPVKLISGHTYYFGFNYKKDSLNDAEYTKILAGLGNSRGNRMVVQASTGDSSSDWSYWSYNRTVCTNVENFGIDIIVNRNAAAYIDGIICYDMADPKKTNLIENGSFEQMKGNAVGEAENVSIIQGVNNASIKWDYPTDTIWSGAQVWNVTEDYEMIDSSNMIAEIEKSSSSQQITVPAVFGDITKYRLILVDKYGNKSKGTDILVSGMDSEQNSYNFAQLNGWTITSDNENQNAPMAVRIDKNYNTDAGGALYVSQSKGDADNFVRIYQQIEAEPSTTYVLSYDAKGVGAANIWRTQMVFASDPWSTSKVIAFANVVKPYWQTKTMEYTTGENEKSLAVNMIFRSSCQLWLDNFKVYKKDDADKVNLLVNGNFEANADLSEVVNAFCTIVDDEYTYLTYELPENSTADSVLIESADGNELYAIVGANVTGVGEIDLNALFANGDIPKKLKLVAHDIYGNESEGIVVNTIPVTEIGNVEIADGKASVSVINQTEDNLPLIMIAAAYDGNNRLLEVKLGAQNNFAKQSMGDSAYTAEVELPKASENIKVMVFDSMSGLKPYF